MLSINPQIKNQIFESLRVHMKAEKAGARDSKNGTLYWTNLASDLNKLGLNKTTTDAVVFWANTQAEQSRQTPMKIRMLHPMEKEFISVDAYDYLLEMFSLGLIGPPQLEMLIENCAYLTSLPASKSQVQKMVLRTFSESLESQGLGVSH